MQNLATDLTNIRLGWSGKAAIIRRAVQILSLNENSEAAYELALEIDQLQDADAIRCDWRQSTGSANQEEWLLNRHLWAAKAAHAYRLERRFWVARGATPEQAAAEARRILHSDQISADDVSCASHASPMAMAAE